MHNDANVVGYNNDTSLSQSVLVNHATVPPFQDFTNGFGVSYLVVKAGSGDVNPFDAGVILDTTNTKIRSLVEVPA